MNVAVGLARLGNRTVLSTQLGDDADGAAIAAHVESSGVRLGDGSRTASSTSTAVAVVGDDGSATYEFDIAWTWTPPRVRVSAPIIHTGSLATFLRPGRDAVAAVFESPAEKVFLSYDPNIRPALLPSRIEALDAFERIARRADFVKLSDDDLAWLYPGLDSEAGIAEILALGPAAVAITGGSRGTTAGSVWGTIHVPALPTRVADTVGAGDSWMSGFLHELAKLQASSPDLDICNPAIYTVDRLDALVNFASRCAAVTVSRPGAEPPYLFELHVNVVN